MILDVPVPQVVVSLSFYVGDAFPFSPAAVNLSFSAVPYQQMNYA